MFFGKPRKKFFLDVPGFIQKDSDVVTIEASNAIAVLESGNCSKVS